VRRLIVLLAAGLLVSACGETPRPASEARVKLELDAPDTGATTREDHVAVRGSVTPADASVRVMGVDAAVSGGEFTADVELRPGGNVIDVTATAPGRRSAAGALRLTRDMSVDVPDVLGKSPEDATSAVKDAGLDAEIQDDGSWLDRLLGAPRVCSTDPPAGTAVERDSKVTLHVARDCG
jgi:hypothetical protein